MEKITILSSFVALLFMHWMTLVESAHTSEAKVISAMQKKDNPYLAVVTDEDAKSGYAIAVKKDLTEVFTDGQIFLLFYIRTDPKADFDQAFIGSLCFLVKNYEEYNKFLPHQIAKMLFPKQKGSCTFTEGENAIRETAQVDTGIDGNKNLFVTTPPYELEVRFLEYEHTKTHDVDRSDYFFRVNFNVGGDINKN